MRRLAGIAAAAAILLSVLTPVAANAATDDADPAVVAAATPTSQPAYRFWSPRYQGHFYTIDPNERDSIIRKWPADWSYEGQKYTAFSTQVSGTIPLYRFWSGRFGGHFYTADEAETDAVIAKWSADWKFEGVAYYVYPIDSSVPDTVAMSRFWSGKFSHHF